MESEITLRIEAEPDEINKNLRKYTSFINNTFEKIGWNIFFEPFENGVVIFFKEFSDFEFFHKLLSDLSELPIVQATSSIQPKTRAILQFEIIENNTNKNSHEYYRIISSVYQKYGDHTQIEEKTSQMKIIYENIDAFQRLMMAVITYLDKTQENGK